MEQASSDSRQHWFIGECMIELREAGEGLLRRSFAGDVFNTAVYFRRAAPARRTCFVSAVGEDAMSAALLERAGRYGLDAGHISTRGERPPGLYLIQTDQHGERQFLYWRSDSAARRMLDPEHTGRLREHLGDCGLLYFSGVTLAILDEERRERLLALASAVRAGGGAVAYDSNFRPALWHGGDEARKWNLAALGVATHALLSFDDEAMLHGDAAPAVTLARVLASGPSEVALRLGAAGSLVQTHGMPSPAAVSAHQAVPVDTTGAGDSFNAAYLAARLAGTPPPEAADAGAALAARVIEAPGAIIGDP